MDGKKGWFCVKFSTIGQKTLHGTVKYIRSQSGDTDQPKDRQLTVKLKTAHTLRVLPAIVNVHTNFNTAMVLENAVRSDYFTHSQSVQNVRHSVDTFFEVCRAGNTSPSEIFDTLGDTLAILFSYQFRNYGNFIFSRFFGEEQNAKITRLFLQNWALNAENLTKNGGVVTDYTNLNEVTRLVTEYLNIPDELNLGALLYSIFCEYETTRHENAKKAKEKTKTRKKDARIALLAIAECVKKHGTNENTMAVEIMAILEGTK